MDIKNLEARVDEVIKSTQNLIGVGNVATYIPELANVDADNFGLAVVTVDRERVLRGDTELIFSMQSISKIISLIMALEDAGEEEVFSRVGTEATEYKFNSIRPIEDRAANPLINAGAITTASLIRGKDVDERFNRVVEKVKILSNSDKVTFLETVYNSEMQTTDINRSIAYYLKSKNIFSEDTEDVLDLYIRNCSIGINIEGLATIAAVLANGGMSLDGKTQLISKKVVKITLALMAACGMYEESGKYLMEVGFPSKSGVSGGIIGIVPGKCGICTYSPRLDGSGNSVRGKKILEELSNSLDLNIFI
ncbi:glutaminase A [Peptoniphilus sp. oral taxon 386]|uniref:glutaminase A n=1 Tax=Peptoniphilus sp. oral taxon 386 TaxID=652713 RepID=UPI0001DA9E61|nr:glutaminase A [Peptoniphilus sp. oral taxon 386]EFI41483.1 glutaminase A [Peptoniphilus sp. oral taxon 386 str. F0131]